jgi:hypothetical protein
MNKFYAGINQMFHNCLLIKNLIRITAVVNEFGFLNANSGIEK